MRSPALVALVVSIGLVLARGALPVAAQDILGLSIRPTSEMPAGTARGAVDILGQAGGNYALTVDLSAASESLKLNAFDGATAFVVWAVGTDGLRHNVGSLDDSLVLTAEVAYPIARLGLTAESNPATMSPSGPDLFAATLRNVQEQAGATAPSQATTTPTTATATTTPGPTATGAAPAPTTAVAPKELPTTGGPVSDVLVLAAIAALLAFIGLRLRSVRV